MSQNIYQFIDLQRVDPPKKPLRIREIESVRIYEPLSEGQTRAQADRCLSCGDPYCRWKYPVHNYIPNRLKLANEGHIPEAAKLSRQANTLPEVYGRICPQGRLCEGSCTLDDELGAVIIGNIKRYINDKAFEMGWRPDMSGVKQTGEKVAIIGADPAGLACVDVLTCDGVKAVVFDRHPEIGGLLTFGIPASKLEKEVVTRRREIFTGTDIEFKLNTKMGHDVQLGDLLSNYDAVFFSVGVCQSVHGGLESEDADGVYAALPFPIVNTKQLMGFGETHDKPFISMGGKRVVILGGGDTAMNYVHASMRQGIKHVTRVYRRDEENTPGSCCEVKNAREEGVESKFSVQPLGIEMDGNDKVSGVKMVHTEMGEPDTKGCRCAEIIAGSEYVVPIDAMIMTFGFRPHNMEWLAKHSVELDSQGRIIVPENNDNAFQTSNPRIFTGGDTARGSDLVVIAIAEDCKATGGIMNRLEVQAR